MHAAVGDRLIIKGHNVGDHDRDAEILEVRGRDGGPPYIVRWEDSGHETLFFPGPDASVQHLGPEVETAHVLVSELVRHEHHHLYAHVQHLLDAADALHLESDSLPDAVHEAYAFLSEDIIPHAAAEEKVLYPAVAALLGTPESTAAMTRQHVEINRLTDRLGQLREQAMTTWTPTLRRNLQQVLDAVHAVLSLHLATEEELYLPLLESKLSTRRSVELAEQLEAAGKHSDVMATSAPA
jgi:iron-sulfur cluster repair protein YtfE (RIC family)